MENLSQSKKRKSPIKLGETKELPVLGKDNKKVKEVHVEKQEPTKKENPYQPH
jgi:hypothetical protein